MSFPSFSSSFRSLVLLLPGRDHDGPSVLHLLGSVSSSLFLCVQDGHYNLLLRAIVLPLTYVLHINLYTRSSLTYAVSHV